MASILSGINRKLTSINTHLANISKHATSVKTISKHYAIKDGIITEVGKFVKLK